MSNYLFPIFAFGLVITGIVFLGVQQAADLAKHMAAQQKQQLVAANEKMDLSSRGTASVAQSQPAASRL